MRLKRALVEAFIVVAVFGLSAWWGARYVTASLAAGHQPIFYQEYFEPAVMMACGRGFVAAVPDMPPVVRAFLQRKTDRFSCEDIPDDVVLSENAVYQRAWIYLLSTVALTWAIVGISWSALSPLYGLLFGVSITAVYAIARVGMGRLVSTLVAAAVAVSTLHLLNLPHLRDYAKAPFVLASVVVLAALVTRPPSWRLTPLLGAAYGAILGVGYGFRTDLLAGLPVLVVVVLLFLPGGPRRFLAVKAASLAVFAGAFILCAWPVLSWVATKGGCQWHVALLGLSSSHDVELGVTTPAVQWGHTYSDSYLYAAVSAYTHRAAPEMGRLEFCAPEYDRMSGQYFRDIFFYAPADMVARAYASALRVTDLPFPWYSDPIDGYVPWIYMPRAGVLRELVGYGWVPVAVAVGVIGALDLRLGLFALFFLAYFGGYPSLQFQNRHYFHLEFITWWAMGFLVQRALDVRRRGEPPRQVDWAVRLRQLAVFALIAFVLLALPLLALRWYQSQHLEDMIMRTLAAPRTVLPVERDAEGILLVPPMSSRQESPDPRELQYLEVTLDPSRCPDGAIVSLQYASGRPDLGRTVRASVDGLPAQRVIMPAFWHLRGVRIVDAPASCLQSLARVELPADIHVLPTFVLPADRRNVALYQEIRR